MIVARKLSVSISHLTKLVTSIFKTPESQIPMYPAPDKEVVASLNKEVWLIAGAKVRCSSNGYWLFPYICLRTFDTHIDRALQRRDSQTPKRRCA